MTFNPNASSSGGRVRRGGGSRARTGGVAVGGGLGVVGIIVLILMNVLGGGGGGGTLDIPGLTSQNQAEYENPEGESIADCTTGADANEDVSCRMEFTALSLDDYWGATLPQQAGIEYELPDFVLFTGQTSTGCGAATSAVGPFYCPPDRTVYIDTTFFEELQSRYGASGGPLAELYVVAHEFGHHIQNQLGTMSSIDQSATGPTSDSVRLELQADCYAGMWVRGASQTKDENGVTYLEPPTRQDIEDALSAAAAVGDDHIQETFQGQVTPHTWTHGSSEQRQRWFLVGHDQGSLAACDTFAVSDGEL
ncbi:MAG TPA: neutral zinc metallopeptidase [Micrococcales bacterium]|uniref:KPN_02809 family neutral zinc metallopeptidase n=1 Tax=Miniimonas arenae TaxID=676201 RepID=UPI000ED27F43|nr:neutral zinc metallopeptidase [Miniimonas arenae]HCX84479.1 neutral zinc metallopeptidase [Micrococcales bacterium]